MRDLRKTFRRLQCETDASEIAEAAFVLPLMFTMLLGIFWFGQAFTIYGAITRAAQEGARAGAAPLCTTCGSPLSNKQYAQQAADAVKAALIASNLDPSLIQTPSPPQLAKCANFQTLNCFGSGAACVQLPVQLLTTLPSTTGGCSVSVYFQYPFKSWLPFTSLNQQLIMLTATAQVQIETR